MKRLALNKINLLKKQRKLLKESSQLFNESFNHLYEINSLLSNNNNNNCSTLNKLCNNIDTLKFNKEDFVCTSSPMTSISQKSSKLNQNHHNKPLNMKVCYSILSRNFK